MKITEDLQPGDTLKIDTELGTVTIDGTEVYGIEGEIFDLPPESNTLQYTDDESSRNLSIEIEFTERYV